MGPSPLPAIQAPPYGPPRSTSPAGTRSQPRPIVPADSRRWGEGWGPIGTAAGAEAKPVGGARRRMTRL